MITETDWEFGLPPYGISVEAFIRGQVRHGKRDYMDTFRVDDCTHPMQNTTLPLDWVEGWKYTHKNSAIAELIYTTTTWAVLAPLLTGIIQLGGVSGDF